MRRRLLIAVVALLLTVVLGWQLLPRRARETPEVRLVQAPHATDNSPFLPAGVTGLSPSLCTAGFEIRGPQDNGIVLTNGPFGVEILDAKGDCLGTGTCGVAGMTFVFGGGTFVRSYHHTSRNWGAIERPELPIPPAARSVRFSVGFRGPTWQERWRMAFGKWGLIRRMPWLANWVITRRLPGTEHWLVHHVEVQLPPFRDDNETNNQHMQPDPAITSLFDVEPLYRGAADVQR
jgi:hypothetical protein